MTTHNESAIDAFRQVLVQLRQSLLPFEVMIEVVEFTVVSENLPLAGFLYREWYTNWKGDLRIGKALYERFFPTWLQIKKQVPDLPPLPSCDVWVKMRIRDQDLDFRDMSDPFFIELIEKIRTHTLTLINGPEAAWALYKAIEHIVLHNIPGDLVECGVWNGGSALLMAMALQHFGDKSRSIYMYDTFEGMPRPTEEDRDWNGKSALPIWSAKKKAEPGSVNWGFGGTLETVVSVVSQSGYPAEKLVFVKGMVEQTIPGIMPEKASLLHLDTDFYSSTYHELVHLYPVLANGGFLIVDDYGYFQGSRKATDRYIAERQLPLYLSRVSDAVRLAIKPPCS